MRYLLFSIVLLMVSGVSAQSTDTTEHLRVKQRINQLFSAMQHGDTAVLRSCFYSDKIVLQTVHKDGQLKEEPLDSFLNQVLEIRKRGILVEERITSWNIQTDQSLSAVWAAYTLYVNGKYSHQGVDAFLLTNTSAGWKIFQLCDTRRH